MMMLLSMGILLYWLECETSTQIYSRQVIALYGDHAQGLPALEKRQPQSTSNPGVPCIGIVWILSVNHPASIRRTKQAQLTRHQQLDFRQHQPQFGIAIQCGISCETVLPKTAYIAIGCATAVKPGPPRKALS